MQLSWFSKQKFVGGSPSKSVKMSSRRPRRSRIYDSNYNIGENYYKSAIDRLDEKYRPSSILQRQSEPPALSPTRRARFDLASENLEDDLELARDRASRVIQKETILDQRSGRRGLELESSFDGQVSFELSNFNQKRKKISTAKSSNVSFHFLREKE